MSNGNGMKSVFKKLFGGSEDRRAFLLNYIPKNSVGAEIGVWKGDFSELVLRTGRFSKYYLVDPYEFMPDLPNRWYGGKVARSQGDMDEIMENTRKRLSGFSGEHVFVRERSNNGAVSIEDATLDFLYVDGNHYYDGVRDDLSNYIRKMKTGGYIILDDWNWLDDDGRASVRHAACDHIRENPNVLQLAEIRAGQAVFLVVDNGLAAA